MKILIDGSKLTDSPFKEGSKFPFKFDTSTIKEFVQEIKLGHPTCYLVSGYRGAGKSSFVRKVEESIGKDDEIVFVYSSFAKYQGHTFLLRGLIRSVYQTLTSDKNKSRFDALKTSEKKLKITDNKKVSLLLETLYEKTFHETTLKTALGKAQRIQLILRSIMYYWLVLFLVQFYLL